jgi:hypothetical protein
MRNAPERIAKSFSSEASPKQRAEALTDNHPLYRARLSLPRESQLMISREVNAAIRESLGLPLKREPVRTLPQEGHVCDFPIWSFSKKRSVEKQLHITYDDGSFVTLMAPLGMPSPSFPGYLDVILYYGQRDLFLQDHTTISVYRILQELELDPTNGMNYEYFRRDMNRTFALFIMTDRFRNPQTGERSHIDYFRVMRRMKLAKNRREASTFYFDDLFIASLRAGYLKRLDWDFCLYLDREREALARFLYGHIIKRIGEKSLYPRNLIGFLRDCGLSYIADLDPYRRNSKLKETVFPALDLLKGEAIQTYELDDRGNIFFIPRD